MKSAALLVLAVILGGCALLPQPAPRSVFNTAGEEEATRTRARVHTELAGGYYELNSMAVALDEVRSALRADPNYGPAYNMAGLIHAALRQDRVAQENFERALRIDPQDPDANHNYGRFLCDRKRETEALKYFHAALANPLYQHPDRTLVNAGICSRRRGDIAGAEGYFKQALKLRPGHPQALYQIAEMAYERGRPTEARDSVYRLAEVATPTAEALWLALRVARKLGDSNAEASYAAQLRRLFPDSKQTSALLAGNFE